MPGIYVDSNSNAGESMATAIDDESKQPKRDRETQMIDFISFDTEKAESLSDCEDLLILAWVLTLHRLQGNSDDPLAWQCQSFGRDGPSEKTIKSQDMLLKDSASTALSLAAIQALLSESCGAEQITSDCNDLHLLLNDGASPDHDASEVQGSKEWTLQFELKTCGGQLMLKPSWRVPHFTRYIATSAVHSFVHIFNCISLGTNQTIAQACEPGPKELGEIWKWTSPLPPYIDHCMHDLIADRAKVHPESPAVCSWEGQLTYGEVEQLSTRLAYRLSALGVRVGTKVPLCFEKSMWTVVGLLAVMKAGGAFVLMDPSQPAARLQTIAKDVGATVILTSKAQADLGAHIAPQASRIVVSADTFQEIDENVYQELQSVPTSAELYIIFTSGSTGKPKGVVISHGNYTSGAIPRSLAVGYKAESRVLDFASYAFDVSIDCILCTLVQGGCICVPSSEQRINDLSGAIRGLNVNMAHMTPSVARVLEPDIMPMLDVLGLGGESISTGDAAMWSQHTQVINAYGPSECTVGCTINNRIDVARNYTTIGKGVGGSIWIVNPDDHERLTPNGGIGELLVEGPIVGLGYLNDPVKTAQAFIEDPVWLTAGAAEYAGRHGRLYKTGDLVKYDPDGTGEIVFVGRKDSQVKLRGQRVELGEIEYHLRTKLAQGTRIATEVIKPQGGQPSLVAFIEPQPLQASEPGVATQITTMPSTLKERLADIDRSLGEVLPIYMVPSGYIPLDRMPMMVSGKTDRKRLREIGSGLTIQELSKLRASSGTKEAPNTTMEEALKRLWVRVLGIEDIGRNDDFFNTGGDSITAMKLVVAARVDGLIISVADIFGHPRLCDMALATVISSSGSLSESEILPFSLLGENWDAEKAVEEVANLCALAPSAIEDVYSCTPLQEGLMALSAKVEEAYVAQRVMELPDEASANMLREAWNQTAQSSPVLRTRIVQVPDHGLMQVVVREAISWTSSISLEQYLLRDRELKMELGKALARYAIVCDNATGKYYFVWTLHHALYDGWSVPLVIERVNKAYRGVEIARTAGFKDFVKYLCDVDQDASRNYWRVQLRGANGPQFPPWPTRGYTTKADSLSEHYISLPKKSAKSRTTLATIIRGAWALVASQYTGSNDVLFGETLTGRTAPISGVEEIEGPMITTVPTRIQVDRNVSAQEYLQTIHTQGVRRIPYEHFGLQHIRRVSPDAQEACDLKTGIIIQPNTDVDRNADREPAGGLAPAGDVEAASEALKFNSYALMLVCTLDADGFLIMASFDSNTVDKPQLERILSQFECAVQQLHEEGDTPIGQIECMSKQEKSNIWEWNSTIPGTIGQATNRLQSHAVKGQRYPNVIVPWIVDPSDHNRLMPAGAVGELLLEGPLASQDFVEDPDWLLRGCETHQGRQGRLHRTGDLVKYASDGSMIFVGSKSNEGKLRGLDIDIGEIQGHLQRRFPGTTCAVEIVEPTTQPGIQSSEATLVAFLEVQALKDEGLQMTIDEWDSPLLLSTHISLPILRALAGVERFLGEILPPYMIPTTYVAIQQMPEDRAMLREMGSKMSIQQLSKLRVAMAEMQEDSLEEKSQPTTEAEKLLQQLWSKLLCLCPAKIGTEDNFFVLGGDSIMAMKLVTAARHEGYILTVAIVFRNPRLADMANALSIAPSAGSSTFAYAPCSALDVSDVDSFLSGVIQPKLGVPTWKIKDVLPTTQIQASAVDATISAPRFSVQYNLIYLDSSIEKDRLFQNCQDVIAHHEILRTVFVKHDDQCLQVVLEELDVPIAEIHAEEDLEDYVKSLCAQDCDTEMPLGSSFIKYMYVTGNGGQNCLIARISHAQYDGVSLPQLLLEIRDRYEGKSIAKAASFSSYIYDMVNETGPKSYPFWRQLLNGSSMTLLSPPSSAEPSTIATSVSKKIDISTRSRETTLASLITAAWAMVLCRQSSTRDVTFGQVVAGRSVDLANIDSIMGPCYQYVPFRVNLQADWSASDLLHYVQEQYVNKGPFESTGMQEIIKHCVDWPEETYYNSIVQHTDVDDFETIGFGDTECRVDDLNPHDEPAQGWRIQSYAHCGEYSVEIVCPESWRDVASSLLESLGAAVEELVDVRNPVLFD